MNHSHEWKRVTKARPCEVCGGPDWCGYTACGSLLRCMRGGETPPGFTVIRSDDEGGILYGSTDDRHRERYIPPAPRHKKPAPTVVDFEAMHGQFRAAIMPGEVGDFAAYELGLDPVALDALRPGFDDEAGAWTFPERDAAGAIVGLVRRFPDGRKLCVKGSRRGLTFAHPLDRRDPVLIVEGQTDCAAGMMAGFATVGRPSASGGGGLLAELLMGRAVVIVGENDKAGREGAERIASKLRGVAKSVKVVFPPDGMKDLRSWIGGGA